ncbi:Tmtc1 [Symbiodinium sp. CCMP2456]|nr:Tmtc1 [Symbiodinium sp. CCMP2456]
MIFACCDVPSDTPALHEVDTAELNTASEDLVKPALEPELSQGGLSHDTADTTATEGLQHGAGEAVPGEGHKDQKQGCPVDHSDDKRGHRGHGPNATEGIHLAFARPDGTMAEVTLRSKPLRMRFSHSSPLTVTQVSEDLSAFTAIQAGNVLTYVNGRAVDGQWKCAMSQLRDALHDLPEGARSMEEHEEEEEVSESLRQFYYATSPKVIIGEYPTRTGTRCACSCPDQGHSAMCSFALVPSRDKASTSITGGLMTKPLIMRPADFFCLPASLAGRPLWTSLRVRPFDSHCFTPSLGEGASQNPVWLAVPVALIIASGLCKESGFTLFAIPFLMELLDFLTAQVADQFQQSVAGNAGKSKERDAGQALARHHKERMGRRRDPVPSLRRRTQTPQSAGLAFSMVSMKPVAGSRAKHSSGIIRRLRLRVGLLLASAICVFVARYRHTGGTKLNMSPQDNPISFESEWKARVLSYSFLHGVYMRLLVWPQYLCYDYSMDAIPIVREMTDCRMLLPLAAYVGAIGTVSFVMQLPARHRRAGLIALALLVVSYLPASNILFPVGTVVGERLLYVPSAGYCLAVIVVLHSYLQGAQSRPWVLPRRPEQNGTRHISRAGAPQIPGQQIHSWGVGSGRAEASTILKQRYHNIEVLECRFRPLSAMKL